MRWADFGPMPGQAAELVDERAEGAGVHLAGDLAGAGERPRSRRASGRPTPGRRRAARSRIDWSRSGRVGVVEVVVRRRRRSSGVDRHVAVRRRPRRVAGAALGGGRGVVHVEDEASRARRSAPPAPPRPSAPARRTVAVGRVGQREVRALLVDGDEAAGAVERPWPGPAAPEDAVTPGLGQAVPVDGAGRRAAPRCGRRGGGIGPWPAPAAAGRGGRPRPAAPPLRRGPAGSAARRRWRDACPRPRGGSTLAAAPAPDADGTAAERGATSTWRRGARPARPGAGRRRAPDSVRSSTLTRSDERLHPRVEVGPHGAHDGDLEHDLRVGRLAHVDQRVAEDLHAADDPGQAHRLGQRGEALERRPRRRAQLGGQRGEEDLAQVVDQLGRQLLGSPAAGQRAR